MPPNVIDEITSELTGKKFIKLWLAFSWKPKASGIHLSEVRIANRDLLPPQGALDQQSPFELSLGRHESGTNIKVQWWLRAYEDLQGIGAYILAGGGAGTAWELVKSKAPLNHGAAWNESIDFTVP